MPGIPESAMREPLILPEERTEWEMPPEEPFQFYELRKVGCLPVQDPCDMCTLRGKQGGAEAVASLDDGSYTCEIQPSGIYGNISAVCCANNAEVRSVASIEVSSITALMRSPQIGGHTELEVAAALADDGKSLSFDIQMMPGTTLVVATFGKADHRGYYQLKVPGFVFDNSTASVSEVTQRHRNCLAPPPPPPPVPPPSPPPLPTAPAASSPSEAPQPTPCTPTPQPKPSSTGPCSLLRLHRPVHGQQHQRRNKGGRSNCRAGPNHSHSRCRRSSHRSRLSRGVCRVEQPSVLAAPSEPGLHQCLARGCR